MRTLAEEIAAWENGIPVEQLDSDQRQRVYIALYQSHLPKLADFGLITYDRNRGIVEPTPLAERISWYLDDDTTDRSTGSVTEWARYYAGATLLSLLLIAGVWLGVVPFVPSGVGLAGIVTLIYAAVTVAMATADGS